MQKLVDNSVGIITAICPHVGYKKAAKVSKTGYTDWRICKKNLY